MKNIELKNLYWNSNIEDRRIIIEELMKRPNKRYRTRSGNIDLLTHIIDPQRSNDKVVVITVSGVFTIEELKEMSIDIEATEGG